MPSSDAYFKKGHKLAKGGAREGSGRPPNWLRDVCDQELSDRKIAQLRAKIAAGEPIITEFKNPKTGKTEQIMRVPTLKDMQEASDWLADRGQGRAPQSIEHKGVKGFDLISLIRESEDERGLDRSV